MTGTFSDLLALLKASAKRERAGLQRTTAAMLEAAEFIPLGSDVLRQAAGIQAAVAMSAQDSIVLASIVSHLAATKPAESCFLNRNTKDFGGPNIQVMLDQFGCKFFGRFDHALRYIESRLRQVE
ncbi:hypothetical protein SBA4_2000012 [Candidatus Sulfopaludibacter sp. SbA4]|nr:hypothetical protein SBA4_2000012 [Candidatus Sulfopaludibacter sp. SbA4]